ncbi:MAG: hypothetical protein P8013_05190 [Candidatus Sulfobium sp.]
MFRSTLFAVLTGLIAVFAFGTAYAGSAQADQNLIYAYYSVHDGANNMSVVQTTTTCSIPTPAFKQAFTYTPVTDPVIACDPAEAKPIGVGDIAQGGGSLEINVDVGPFDEPVDVSLGIFDASFDASNIFFINVYNEITSLQDEFADASDVQGGLVQNNPPGQSNGKKNFKRLVLLRASQTGRKTSRGSYHGKAMCLRCTTL